MDGAIKGGWYPVGSLACPSSQEISKAIFSTEDAFLQGAFRIHGKQVRPLSVTASLCLAVKGRRRLRNANLQCRPSMRAAHSNLQQSCSEPGEERVPEDRRRRGEQLERHEGLRH
jgi:hypothetical protein